MVTIKVIHTLQKPYDRLYAGIYIQDPIDGVLDKYGNPLRALHDVVGIREVPNRVIALCIRKMLDRCPCVNIVEYQTPRRGYVSISRGQDVDSILKALTEAGSYVS